MGGDSIVACMQDAAAKAEGSENKVGLATDALL